MKLKCFFSCVLYYYTITDSCKILDLILIYDLNVIVQGVTFQRMNKKNISNEKSVQTNNYFGPIWYPTLYTIGSWNKFRFKFIPHSEFFAICKIMSGSIKGKNANVIMFKLIWKTSSSVASILLKSSIYRPKINPKEVKK